MLPLPASSSSGLSLEERACAGEIEAFSSLVGRHQCLVEAVLLAAGASHNQLDDLRQEVFLEAWTHRAQLREPAKFQAWLCSIARNRFGKSKRRGWRETAVDGPELIERRTPESRLVSQEHERVIEAALQTLPARHREVLVLFYREERSLAEVAKALGLSESATQKRVSRARLRLRPELESKLREHLPKTSLTALGPLAVAAICNEKHASAAVPSAAVAGKKGIGIMKLTVTLAATVSLAVASGAYMVGWGSESSGQAHSSPSSSSGSTAKSSASPEERRTSQRSPGMKARKLTREERARRLARFRPSAKGSSTRDIGDRQTDRQTERQTEGLNYLRIVGTATFVAQEYIDECVEVAHVSSPALYGGMELEIAILGGEGVAGLVSSVAVQNRTGALILGATALGAAELEECVRESLLSLEFTGLAERFLNIEGGLTVPHSFTFYPKGGVDMMSEEQLFDVISQTRSPNELLMIANATRNTKTSSTVAACDRMQTLEPSDNARMHCVRILCLAKQAKAAKRHWKSAVSLRKPKPPPRAQSTRDACTAILPE